MLADHFLDAELRGKRGHGLARIAWLETLGDLRADARPERVADEAGFERWEGRGALGYLTLAAICERLVERRPTPARLVVAADCFPTGALGYWVRRLAESGLVAVLTATSPARLPHPQGDEPLVGTNPLAIGIPADNGDPIVVDVSMGKVTYGEVLAGVASADELVPFGGEHAHKAFALALGLQLLVESFTGGRFGAFLVAAEPDYRVADAFRERATGLRMPGDS